MLRDYSTISEEAFEILLYKIDMEDIEYIVDFILASKTWHSTELWHIANDLRDKISAFRTEMEEAFSHYEPEDD